MREQDAIKLAAHALPQLRNQLGLSQRAFSARCGISRKVLADFEAGRRPRVDTVDAERLDNLINEIIDTLGVSLDAA